MTLGFQTDVEEVGQYAGVSAEKNILTYIRQKAFWNLPSYAWSTLDRYFFFKAFSIVLAFQQQINVIFGHRKWSFWKTPSRVKTFSNPVCIADVLLACVDRACVIIYFVHRMIGSLVAGSLPVIAFFRLLIGQHGFRVWVISPPVGLACSWQPFNNVFASSYIQGFLCLCGWIFFLEMKEGKPCI